MAVALSSLCLYQALFILEVAPGPALGESCSSWGPSHPSCAGDRGQPLHCVREPQSCVIQTCCVLRGQDLELVTPLDSPLPALQLWVTEAGKENAVSQA